MSGPIRLRLEPRTAIMARAEVVWEDQPGAWRGVWAKIEDMSRSGACIRLSVPIGVGARMKIKWQREEFSGVARYCRRDGGDYVLGIQRETSKSQEQAGLPTPSSTNVRDAPARQEMNSQELPKSSPAPATAPMAAKTASSPTAAKAVPIVAHESAAVNKITSTGDPSLRLPREPATHRQDEVLAQEPSESKERTIVFNKLLHLGSGRQQQNAQDGIGSTSKAQANNTGAKTNRENQTNANTRASGLPPRQGSLLSTQDIYLAEGIMSSRLGYNIDTLSAMLDSSHLRGMTSDVKRGSVLMALEAAGIPVDELLQDGAKRLEALNVYEEGERKRFEEYEARKSQESDQIQLEIERMTAHCHDRIKQNLSEVTVAKDAFLNWQTTKQKEAQRISDAVALFMKPPAVEKTSDSNPALQAVGTNSKP